MVSVGSHNNNVLNALVNNQELAVSDIFLCHAADLICQLKSRRDGHVSPWKHTLVVRRNEVQLRELKKVDCLVPGTDQRFDGGKTPVTGSKPASRNAGMILISNSSRLEARARTTSSPQVVGSNISVFHSFLEQQSSPSSGQLSLSVSRNIL